MCEGGQRAPPVRALGARQGGRRRRRQRRRRNRRQLLQRNQTREWSLTHLLGTCARQGLTPEKGQRVRVGDGLRTLLARHTARAAKEAETPAEDLSRFRSRGTH